MRNLAACTILNYATDELDFIIACPLFSCFLRKPSVPILAKKEVTSSEGEKSQGRLNKYFELKLWHWPRRISGLRICSCAWPCSDSPEGRERCSRSADTRCRTSGCSAGGLRRKCSRSRRKRSRRRSWRPRSRCCARSRTSWPTASAAAAAAAGEVARLRSPTFRRQGSTLAVPGSCRSTARCASAWGRCRARKPDPKKVILNKLTRDGPWWSSGQHSRFLLWWYEFESYRIFIFYVHTDKINKWEALKNLHVTRNGAKVRAWGLMPTDGFSVIKLKPRITLVIVFKALLTFVPRLVCLFQLLRVLTSTTRCFETKFLSELRFGLSWVVLWKDSGFPEAQPQKGVIGSAKKIQACCSLCTCPTRSWHHCSKATSVSAI